MYRIRDAYSIEGTALAKADACPVVDLVETIAEKYNISTTLLCDTNHILYSDYSEVIVVGAGADDVRFAQSFEKLVLMTQAKEGEQSGTV